MTRFQLVRRQLLYSLRSHCMTGVAVAIATAVIVGALLVGHSMKQSLHSVALERVGPVDMAVRGEHFFREELAENVSTLAAVDCLPALIVRGQATLQGPDSNMPVTILGLTPEVIRMIQRSETQNRLVADDEKLPSNDCILAGERLPVIKDQGSLLLRIPSTNRFSDSGVFDRRNQQDTLQSFRFNIANVYEEGGLTHFSLDQSSEPVLNVVVNLDVLQKRLHLKRKINTLLIQKKSPDQLSITQRLEDALVQSCKADDYGYSVSDFRSKAGYMRISGRRLSLPTPIVQDLTSAFPDSVRVSIHLANRIDLVRNDQVVSSTPYSTIVGFDPVPESIDVTLTDSAIRELASWTAINRWLASDLGAHRGDRLRFSYYTRGDEREILEKSVDLSLVGILPMDGLSADRHIVPEIRGLTDVEQMEEWDPPFPVNTAIIREKDELYWDQFGTAPKAIVPFPVMKKIWVDGSHSTGTGSVTSILLFNVPPEHNEHDISSRVGSLITRSKRGLQPINVRQIALQSSRGNTDFSVLFLSMGSFLVLAAALLIVILLRLIVAQRRTIFGLQFSLGFTGRAVMKVFLTELGIVSGVGIFAGSILGIVYAWGIIELLRSGWADAVGGFPIRFSFSLTPIFAGVSVSLVLTAMALYFGVKGLSSFSPVQLLRFEANQLNDLQNSNYGLSVIIGSISFIIGIAFVVLAIISPDRISPVVAFYLAGAFLLLSCIVFLRAFVIAFYQSRAFTWYNYLTNNIRRNCARSLAITDLVASGVFVMVAVAANHMSQDAFRPNSKQTGSGGFRMIVDFSLPLMADPTTEGGMDDLVVSRETFEEMGRQYAVSILVKPGDETSCLNMNHPDDPKVFGVDPSDLYGRFVFQSLSKQLPQNIDGHPWQALHHSFSDNDDVIPAVADAASAQWILKKSIDNIITIRNPTGHPIRLRLVGLLQGSIFQSGLLISKTNFRKHFGHSYGIQRLLIDCPGNDVAKMSALINSDLSAFGPHTNTTEEVLYRYIRLQNTYLSAFSSLGGLGILLGALGVSAVLMRAISERQKEMSILWALGFEKRCVRTMIVLEHTCLVTVGMLCGVGCALVATAPRLFRIGLSGAWCTVIYVLVLTILFTITGCYVAAEKMLDASPLKGLRSE